MSSPLRRPRQRLPLMLASLVLAVAFWLFVAVREQVEVGYLVPLAFEGFPSRLVIDSAPLEAAYVRLSGPRDTIEAIDAQQLRVRVNLAAARAGNNILPLAGPMVVVPRGVNVEDISPPAVNIRFIARPRAEEEASP